MKARLIKKTEINEAQSHPVESRATVRTKVSDVIEWVKESRESTSPIRGLSARERFEALFARNPQLSNR